MTYHGKNELIGYLTRLDVMKSLLLLLLTKLSGRDFKEELRIIESINEGEIDLEDFIEGSLRNLLIHSYDKVRYYRPVLEEAGVIKDGEVFLQNFSKVRILSRLEVQDRFQDLLSKDIASRKYYTDATGGSMGRPIRIVKDLSSYRWAKAAEFFYYDRFIGVNETLSKKVVIWGYARELLQGISIRDKIAYYLTNTLYLNAYLLDEDRLRKIVRKINNYKPDILRGFSSFLYMLGRYILENNLEVHSPKAVISTAETLTSHRRRVIEDAFGAKVHNFYGATEAPSIAGECSRGSMHVFSFNNLVEILDNEGDPVPEESLGRVIITPLHNYAMPLIRYEIGDMAIARYRKCSCGSTLPTLGNVSGRIMEFVVRRDGTLLSGEFFDGVFQSEEWVSEFQVIQEDYDLLRILIVPREKSGMNLDIPHKKILSVMGEDCKIKWEIVDEIPKPPSGKHLYVRSLVTR